MATSEIQVEEYIQSKNKIHNVSAENSITNNYRKLELSREINLTSKQRNFFLYSTKDMTVSFDVSKTSTELNVRKK